MTAPLQNNVILRIRPAKEGEKETSRGPLYAESAIASLHALKGKNALVQFEVGMGGDGRIAFFVRATEVAAQLAQSQLYAQYPEIDIDREVDADPFATREDEEVITMDLGLKEPEIYPIKRHPQFDDLLSRVNVNPIAGITSALARNDIPGMRGHMQVVLKPIGGSYRKRAWRFLPLLQKGMSTMSGRYANAFARVQLARGWRRLVFLPVSIFMGGFRAWPGFSKFMAGGSSLLSDAPVSSDPDEHEHVTARNHDREDAIAAAQDKVNRLLFVCNVRISVIVPKGHRLEGMQKLQEIAGSFRQFALPHTNTFRMLSPRVTETLPLGFTVHPYVLSVEEIATLWHLPTAMVQTPNIDWVLSKKLEPPINLPIPAKHANVEKDPAKHLTLLGEAVFRGSRTEFGIKTDDRRRHIYVIGKTGMGKSTLLENMLFSDIHAGRGIGLIDPHGDLVEAVLKFIPKERSNDVILFDPSDKDFPISFNILECRDRDQQPLVASGIMSVFTKLWPDVWSGRMEHILRNTLLALLQTEGSSMLGIMRMFADDSYRGKVVSRLSDPLVRSFWEDEYASWSEKYRTEAIAAIQNKVGQLLSTPLIRNIIGQVTSTVDIRHAMDTGKIILVNLSKGKLGEDTSAFLGSMLVTKFQLEAMSRADIPENDRRDFFLYVDEFQNFATESFATILSEARKYRLSLTMANQYVAQLLIGDKSTKLQDAVFGNVGTMVSFQVGSDDAEELSKQFEEMVVEKDILSLPKYHAYLRLMIDGIPSKPFSVSTLPPPVFEQDLNRVEIIRKLSRERYSEKRQVVEEKIKRWAESAKEGRVTVKSAEKAKEKEEEEKKKAREKKMTLEEYRKWRDKEMWTNDFNALRKRSMLGEALTSEETAKMQDLEKKLEASGGVPPPSKTLLAEVEKKKGAGAN
ncbi:hypothetical protein A2881_00095 [Candidatus Peribacteria bacterium RIFCSPHIGHO2_01_FULL_55_13]|nr:MAG: hypothetical protein A2881_00095 [Candidatus Peribacteria bacterium RIFCSPHIGHO2_01_FULL_55_13]